MRRGLVVAFMVVVSASCPGERGEPGPAGQTGSGGQPCTVVDNGNGTATMTCPDGTSTTFPNAVALDGGVQTCTVVDNGNGTATMTCPDGTGVTIPILADAGVDADAAVEDAYVPDTYTPDLSVMDSAVADTSSPGGIVPTGPCQGYYWSEVVEGSYEARNSLELSLLSGIRCITGGLVIFARGISSLAAIDGLERAGAGVMLHYADSVTSFVLPNLVAAGGLVVSNTSAQLTRVYMPRLAQATGGHINLTYNQGLQTFEAPLLHATDGLYVNQNPVLSSVSLPLLANVYDNFNFDGNPLLRNCAIIRLSEQVTLGRPGIGGFPPFIQNNDDPCQPDPCVGSGDGGSSVDAGTCAQDCAQALDYVCQ